MDIPAMLTGAIGTVFTGGGLWVGLRLWVDHRKNRAEGARSDRDFEAQRDERAVAVMERAMGRLDAEVERLSKADESSRARISRLESSNRELADENRTFRQVIVGVMERLRRQPPDEPASILAFILKHLPHLGKDPS